MDAYQDIITMEDVNGAVENYQTNDIVLPNCTDLDWAQIIYAINYKRILFIHRYQTWSSFHTNSYNGFNYNDYTPHELSHRFLQRVLPNIFEYELRDDEFHLLNLLDLHPSFEKTNTGFEIVEQTDLIFPSDEAAVTALIATEVLQNEANFIASDVKSNSQIVTIGASDENPACRKFNFNEENSALLSVVLCSEEELANCELLSIEEVFKRLKAAKGQFEKNAHQLENVNISLDDLLKKVHTLSKLKEAVVELMDNSLCRQNNHC